MSNHRQSTTRGPSVPSIVTGTVLTLAAITVSFWIAWTGEGSRQELAGSALGMVLAVLLLSQTLERLIDRQAVKSRARRAALELARERAVHVGTWLGADADQELTVRWEPATAHYLIEGWISDLWQIHPETHWDDREQLASMLRDLESSGEMVPVDDEGTRGIRARLDLIDFEVCEPAPVATRPIGIERSRETWGLDAGVGEGTRRLGIGVGEETHRLVRPRNDGQRDPATLRPVAVPTFRTEVERAEWAAERMIPTEFLPCVRS